MYVCAYTCGPEEPHQRCVTGCTSDRVPSGELPATTAESLFDTRHTPKRKDMDVISFGEHGGHNHCDTPTHRTRFEQSSQFSNHHQNAFPSFTLPCHSLEHKTSRPMKLSWQIQQHSTWTHRSTASWDFHATKKKSGETNWHLIWPRLGPHVFGHGVGVVGSALGRICGRVYGGYIGVVRNGPHEHGVICFKQLQVICRGHTDRLISGPGQAMNGTITQGIAHKGMAE